MSSISPEIQSLKEKVLDLQTTSVDYASEVLSKTNIKDVESTEKVIVNAVSFIKQFSKRDEGKFKGFISSITKKMPWGDKISEKINEMTIENMSMEEGVEQLHNSVKDTLDRMNEDLDCLYTVKDSIQEGLNNGNKILDLINQEIINAEESDRKFDLSYLKRMKLQLEAIQYQNEETVTGLDIQLKSSEATAQILAQVLPVIRPILYQQATLAVANINNERVRTTFNVVTEVLNEMIVSNKEATHNTIKDTYALAHSKVIKADTIKKVEQLNNTFEKEMLTLVKQKKQETIEYQDSLNKAKKNLLEQNKTILLEENVQ